MRSRVQPFAIGVMAFGALVDARAIGMSLNPRYLGKRSITAISCGGFSTADIGDSQENISNLNNKGGTATASANSCSRVGCYNTSGVYLCNDQDVDVTVDLSQVSTMANYIVSETCIGNGPAGVSGQVFADDDGGFNVVVAFCDNNEAVDTPPSSYTPPGPNGSPGVTCGGNDATPCSLGTCDTSTIVVETADRVICDEYLGPAYIGAGANYVYDTTRTVGSSWSYGGFLGINIGDLSSPLAVAGFSFSFTETTTTGTTAGSTEQCGEGISSNGFRGNWTCGMDVQPSCIKMTGTCHASDPTDGTDLGTVPWGNLVPQIDSGDGQSIYAQNLCVCKDCAGWADDGAPQLACNLPCADCDTPVGGT